MTKREIRRTQTGSITEYEETSAERAARIKREAEEAAKELQITSGQAKVLKRVQARARDAASA